MAFQVASRKEWGGCFMLTMCVDVDDGVGV